jgi:uncharacterized RDD family membrane protein YckC
VTTFREYREAMARGVTPELQVPAVPSDVVDYQGTRAGFVSRALAATIDVALVFLVVLGTIAVIWALSFIFSPEAPGSTGSLAPDRIPGAAAMVLYGYFLNWAYWTIGWATSGRTIGNLIMGLRVVNYQGRHPRWIGAALRSAFCTVFPFGLLWVIPSGANRSVQDVVLRTSVVYDWVISIPGFRKAARVVPEAPEVR